MWWKSYYIKGKPISQLSWDMIAILAMSSEYEQVFINAGRLVIFFWNRLKENVIKASKYLSAQYKQELANQIKGE